MDTRLYKKKGLAFVNTEARRISRHAETLKARESSRFKRLSMLRNLEDDENHSTEAKVVKREEKKKPPTRLEMMYKWKKEKEMKKELDKKKKPFYVGGQPGKSTSNMGLSSVAKSNGSLHSSRITKSRLTTPSSTHPPKVINSTKQNGGKTASVTKTNGVSTKNPKTFGYTAASSSTQGSVPRIAQSTKVLGAKTAPGIKMTAKPPAVKSQVSALPKPISTKQPTKPVIKTGIPSFPSNSLKGNSAQKMKNQKPVTTPVSKLQEKKPVTTSVSKLQEKKPVTTPVSKLQEKVAPHLTENVSNKKKENCLKIAPSKLPGVKNGASNSGLQKKGEEKNKNFKEEIDPEPRLESASSIFECDISIINHTASFAPANFKFAPPTGLLDFFSDDETFARIKEKCISRTSTPSKECKKSSSPVVEVACSDSSLIDNGKDVSKDLLVERRLQKETDINLPSDTENKSNLPNEQKNSPILDNDSFDFLLNIDVNKIEKIIAEHKRLQEENEETNSGNDHLNESENEEPAKEPEYVSIDSPFNIIDLSDSDDLKPLESLKLHHEPIHGNDKELSKKENNQSIKVLEELGVDSPLQIIDLNTIEKISTNDELVVLQQEELVNGNDEELNKKESNQSTKVLEELCVDSPFQIIDLNSIEKISTNDELVVLQQEEFVNDKLLNKKENSQRTKASKDAHVDSPLKIVDLNKIEKISANNVLDVLEEEELMNDDLCNQQDQDKYIKKKLGVYPTRPSMLKSVSVLNSIAEIAEPEDCTTQTPNVFSEDKQTVTPSRQSQRLQPLVTMDENSGCSSVVTPRRSLRLVAARKCQFEESNLSPKPKSNLRRSMRLIDLNTPDKEIANSPVAKTNITSDFEKLTLMEPENINPHACLLDECSPVPKAKSKKVSLLYSPEKVRRSMRRSIRGDLMSFSPSN